MVHHRGTASGTLCNSLVLGPTHTQRAGNCSTPCVLDRKTGGRGKRSDANWHQKWNEKPSGRQRRDNEYERCSTANVFFTFPLQIAWLRNSPKYPEVADRLLWRDCGQPAVDRFTIYYTPMHGTGSARRKSKSVCSPANVSAAGASPI
jgi:hypothetical protein